MSLVKWRCREKRDYNSGRELGEEKRLMTRDRKAEQERNR